jgi:hypothetical protein
MGTGGLERNPARRVMADGDGGSGARSIAEPAICSNPIFVIGSPRSGTTVLAESLAKHSRLWASGENDLFFFLFADGTVQRAFDRATEIPGRRLVRLEEVSREEFLSHIGMGINALITDRSDGLRWIDHTPLNTRIVDTLADVFPTASFIHIHRDGREVVHSMLNFARAVPDPAVGRFLERNVTWTTEMSGACTAWREHVDAATRFCDDHEDRTTVVRYEGLVAEPEATFRSVHAFLGLANEDGPAEFLRSRRINSSFRANPRLTAAELWDTWDAAARRTFAELAGPTMVDCGYLTPEDLGAFAESGHRGRN